MVNPYDNRMIMSMIAFRTAQMMDDTGSAKVIDRKRRASNSGAERVRRAIGTALMRAGARISGEHTWDLPGMQPGV